MTQLAKYRSSIKKFETYAAYQSQVRKDLSALPKGQIAKIRIIDAVQFTAEAQTFGPKTIVIVGHADPDFKTDLQKIKNVSPATKVKGEIAKSQDKKLVVTDAKFIAALKAVGVNVKVTQVKRFDEAIQPKAKLVDWNAFAAAKKSFMAWVDKLPKEYSHDVDAAKDLFAAAEKHALKKGEFKSIVDAQTDQWMATLKQSGTARLASLSDRVQFKPLSKDTRKNLRQVWEDTLHKCDSVEKLVDCILNAEKSLPHALEEALDDHQTPSQAIWKKKLCIPAGGPLVQDSLKVVHLGHQAFPLHFTVYGDSIRKKGVNIVKETDRDEILRQMFCQGIDLNTRAHVTIDRDRVNPGMGNLHLFMDGKFDLKDLPAADTNAAKAALREVDKELRTFLNAKLEELVNDVKAKG
jgi:hypothetical protein